MILDDYGYGNQLLSKLENGMRFANQPLMDSLFCQQASWLPLATVATDNSNRADTGTVLLNYATALVECEDAKIIARSSPASPAASITPFSTLRLLIRTT